MWEISHFSFHCPASHITPLTSMGTHSIAHALRVFAKHYQPIPLEVYGANPYKILVSTLLSARTRDETTFSVCENLFKRAKNFHKLSQLPSNLITQLIHPVGFYITKAKHLKEAAQIISKKYNGEVPDNITALIGLPGIGRKTANLVLARAFGKPAISVDTHVHRVSNTLGWVNTKRPEQTEQELMKIIPKNQWGQINRLLVSIGRQYRSHRKLTKFLEENKLLSTS